MGLQEVGSSQWGWSGWAPWKRRESEKALDARELNQGEGEGTEKKASLQGLGQLSYQDS